MKSVWKAATLAALTLPVLFAGTTGFGQTLRQLEQNAPQTFVDGIEAFIYGYPLLMFGVTERTATTVPNAFTKLGAAPLNQFGKELTLPDAKFDTVVLPSTSTLYTSAFLDLSEEPIILHLPNFGSRFFLMQMLDGWTDVSMQSPGSRLGSQEGDYALVGPNFKGKLPRGLEDTIRFPTNSMWIIGRIFTSGSQADINQVVNTIYPGLTLTPLSQLKNKKWEPPSNLGVDPMAEVVLTPLKQVANMDACAFFGNMAAMMKYNPSIPGQDDAILPRLAGVGLVAGAPFDCSSLSAQKRATLQLAVAAGKLLLNSAPPPTPTPTQWVVSLGVGTYGNNYLLRAEVAKDALGANNAIDAVYGITTYDGSGAPLDGSKKYKIHFNATGSQGLPPVKGFWSLTIYDAAELLVNNPDVSYNAIGMPSVQNHQACYNSDDSLDLYLQSTKPTDPTQLCNWLATPSAGGYTPFLRMYWPEAPILNQSWIPPAITLNQ